MECFQVSTEVAEARQKACVTFLPLFVKLSEKSCNFSQT